MFLHDAEQQTDSWKRRHSPEAIAQMGVWRWKGIQKHAAMILDLICGKQVIDFGGADGPLGFGSTVVDLKAECKTLGDVDGNVDVIFTSHVLEHLDDPNSWIRKAHSKLMNNGVLIVHVPSFTCKRWRAEQYDNPKQQNGHKRNYCLALCTTFTAPIPLSYIDSSIKYANDSHDEYFDIELKEYVGDDSILVIARKP